MERLLIFGDFLCIRIEELQIRMLKVFERMQEQQKSNYVRYDEMLLKAFIEKYVYKKILLFAEVGYSFGKSPLQYTSETNELNTSNPVYTRLKNYPFFNVGLAYRVRLDSDKNK